MKTLKFFIVGPFSSGKSTFIQAISEIGGVAFEAGWEENTVEYSVALEFGRLTVSDVFLLYFFAHPAALRIDRTLNYLTQKGLSLTEVGFIVMMDSIHPEHDGQDKWLLKQIMPDRDRENSHYLSYIQGFGHPCIVALSRQDLPNARTPQQIRDAVTIPDEVKVLSYDRRKPATAKQVVLELIELFPRDEIVQQAINGLKVQIENP